MSTVSIKPAVLIALWRHGEGYGLEIIDWIRQDTGIDMTFSQGRIYPALHDLEAEGCVTSRRGLPLPARGGRPRVYYRLTDKGVKEATEALDAVESMVSGLVPQGT